MGRAAAKNDKAEVRATVATEATGEPTARKLRIERWPVAKLKPYDKNAKTHPKKQVKALAALIARHGFDVPIVVESDGTIIKGHGRMLAAKELGIETVPVVVRDDLTPAQVREARIADNTVSGLGKWDEGLLVADVKDALDNLDGFDVDLLGLKASFVSEHVRVDLGLDGSSETEEPEVPEQPKNPVVKSDDVWELGDHVLVCGDSFDDGVRARGTGGAVVDLVVTDPPYAIYGSSTGIGADIADDKMVRPFFDSLMRLTHAALRDFGHAYFCTDWRSWSVLWEAAKRTKLSPKNCIVWDKGNRGLGASYYMCHEFVGFFAKLPTQQAMRSNDRVGQRTVYAPNIFRCERPTNDERQHNAAKPVVLFEALVENSSDEGQRVCDFFGGSGTTILACERKNRRALVFEIEPGYCDIAIARWEQATGKKARRVAR